MNDYLKQLLLDLEIANEKIQKAQKEKDFVYQKLSSYKKSLEKQNSHLIGKKAICLNAHKGDLVECICTKVVANDDYKTVTPLFKRNGKNYSVVSYEWID